MDKENILYSSSRVYMSTPRQLLQRKIQQWLGKDAITRNGLTNSAIWIKKSVHHKPHTEHTWHGSIFTTSKKESPVKSVERIEFNKHTLYKCDNDIFEIVDLKFVPPNDPEADLDQITVKLINYDSEHTLKVPRHGMTPQDWSAMSMKDLQDYEVTTEYLDALELLEFSRNQVAEEFRADALRDCKVNERKLTQELSRLTANIVAGKVDKMDFLKISVSIPDDDTRVIITSENPSDPSSQKKYRLYIGSMIETEIPKDSKTDLYIFDKIDPSTHNFIPKLPLHRVHCKVIGIDYANKRVQFLMPKDGDRTFYVTDNGDTYFWRRFVINQLKLDDEVYLSYKPDSQELEIKKTVGSSPSLLIKRGDTIETRVPFVGDIPQYNQTAKKNELINLRQIKCKVRGIDSDKVTFEDKDRTQLFTIDMNGHMYFWKNIAKLNKMLGWLGLGKKSLKGGFSKQTDSFVTRKTSKQRRRQTRGTN